MRILTPGFVRHYAGRLINIHPSLLPQFPGLDTHARAIASDAKVHGATVHFVTDELDGGPVIAQVRVPVLADDDDDALAARVLEHEHIILPTRHFVVCEAAGTHGGQPRTRRRRPRPFSSRDVVDRAVAGLRRAGHRLTPLARRRNRSTGHRRQNPAQDVELRPVRFGAAEQPSQASHEQFRRRPVEVADSDQCLLEVPVEAFEFIRGRSRRLGPGRDHACAVRCEPHLVGHDLHCSGHVERAENARRQECESGLGIGRFRRW